MKFELADSNVLQGMAGALTAVIAWLFANVVIHGQAIVRFDERFKRVEGMLQAIHDDQKAED